MKKKRILGIVCCILLLGFATGCENESASGGVNTGNANKVEDVLQDRISETEGNKETQTAVMDDEAGEKAGDIYATEGVDIDLTQLSGTLLYSQVNYMLYKPEEFLGKTVKLPGTFSAVYSEDAKRYYFGCLVADRAACCVIGVEFELPESCSYPEDYPAEEEEIIVFGTLIPMRKVHTLRRVKNSSAALRLLIEERVDSFFLCYKYLRKQLFV